MGDLSGVPIIDVTTDNLQDVWPALLSAINSATFIALDNELSGLGERKQIMAKVIDDRYRGISEVAKSRSIISIGLSCFQLTSVHRLTEPDASSSSKPSCNHIYHVQTFNIFLLCDDNYIVEPQSLKFLVDHGFDFNKQYAAGLPYYRGNDKNKDEQMQGEPTTVRQLFSRLLQSKVPLVLHNALVDLIFLYHSLYAHLPASLASFLADMSEMYQGGVYDTKYVTEYKARMPASYLEYVFRKSQRENYTATEKLWSHVTLTFTTFSPETQRHVVSLACSLNGNKRPTSKNDACEFYAVHGWCPNTSKCPKSHDIDVILDSEDNITAKKKRKRQRNKNTISQVEAEDSGNTSDHVMSDASSSDNTISDPEKIRSRVAGHRAGFDAFMTGFIFAFFTARYGNPQFDHNIDSRWCVSDLGVEEFANKVFLSGKDIPLQVTKSSFSKTSKDHREKMARLSESS